MEFIFEILAEAIEFVFEILFELIFEGSLEIAAHKKIAMPFRILALLLFLLVSVGFLVILFMIAIEIMENTSVALGIIFIIFDVFLLGCIIYAIRKKMKNR